MVLLHKDVQPSRGKKKRITSHTARAPKQILKNTSEAIFVDLNKSSRMNFFIKSTVDLIFIELI